MKSFKANNQPLLTILGGCNRGIEYRNIGIKNSKYRIIGMKKLKYRNIGIKSPKYRKSLNYPIFTTLRYVNNQISIHIPLTCNFRTFNSTKTYSKTNNMPVSKDFRTIILELVTEKSISRFSFIFYIVQSSSSKILMKKFVPYSPIKSFTKLINFSIMTNSVLIIFTMVEENFEL